MTPFDRSNLMRKIKSADTKLELKIRAALHSQGLRYRISNRLPGKPDIVFAKFRVAIFIDSCFWHGCPKHFRVPKSNVGFWKEKIERNRKRDAFVSKELRREGWIVLRFWEHQIRSNPDKVVLRIKESLKTPNRGRMDNTVKRTL